jgi:hypothetical protein
MDRIPWWELDAVSNTVRPHAQEGQPPAVPRNQRFQVERSDGRLCLRIGPPRSVSIWLVAIMWFALVALMCSGGVWVMWLTLRAPELGVTTRIILAVGFLGFLCLGPLIAVVVFLRLFDSEEVVVDDRTVTIKTQLLSIRRSASCPISAVTNIRLVEWRPRHLVVRRIMFDCPHESIGTMSYLRQEEAEYVLGVLQSDLEHRKHPA